LAELPDWLLQILAPLPSLPSPPCPPSTPSSHTWGQKPDAYVLAAINGECRAVAVTKPGERNSRLFKASARLGDFVSVGVLPREVAERALEQAADLSGLPGDDGWESVRRTIKSGLDKGALNLGAIA
jgi:putative DNA primase/helicase